MEENRKVTKQMQWERKLLDLSLRNMLINLRLTKSVVPLLTADPAAIEDALADGEEFLVTPLPGGEELEKFGRFEREGQEQIWTYQDQNRPDQEQLRMYQAYISLECKHKRIPSVYSEKELGSALTKLYRAAKTSLEESGTSTLYLAVGLLRWLEKKAKKEQLRYAPIVLIPIEIIRKSASQGYTMRMRDEDAQINITMLEFLKQNYNLVISGLEPLPSDEHGADMKKIFEVIRQAVSAEEGWDVVESALIGSFSFSQFVMWNDIHSGADFLEKNKIVRSLIKGAIDWDCTVPETVDTDEPYLPVTADASQIRAVNMAANGVSFVLHGPPGTGKSQTITAMIANALTRGRTVLFAAEKRAALEVVQKRLEALGIGDFCLELHSDKATKKAVLDRLKRGLELEKTEAKTAYDSRTQEIRRMKEHLDAYAKALHEKRFSGKSLHELIDAYENVPPCGAEVLFDRKEAGSLTQTALDHQRLVLERLVAAGRAVGHPSGHALEAVHQTEYSTSLRSELKNVVEAYQLSLADHREKAAAFAAGMEIPMPESEIQWKKMEDHAKAVLSVESIPRFLVNADNIDAEFIAPMDYVRKAETLHRKKEALLAQWDENFLRMDMSIYHAKYDQAGQKLLGKGRAYRALKRELQSFASFKVLVDAIPALLADVELYRKEEEKLEAELQSLSVDWRVRVPDYASVQEFTDYREQIKSKIDAADDFFGQLRKRESEGALQTVLGAAKDVLQSAQILKEREEKAAKLLKLSFEDEVSERRQEAYENESADWLQKRLETCRNILAHASELKDWIVYRQFEKEAEEAGLAPVCAAYEAGLPHDDVINVYLKSVYKSVILYIIESEPSLNGFTGIGFNERIAQFKKLDQELMELTKTEMYGRLTKNLPTDFESVEISRELNILRRAISSNGRGVSIRTLFEQIPNVLKKLCPCMLMSPASVAQYLSDNSGMADIVIFDESSQIPTCRAVGVLARGKNAVIVGDPNQMVPTSFFAGNAVDEENLETEDLDSILDDCLALGMTQTYLNWHYRSRHESLIAFSNHEFYENRMRTFPSRNDRERCVKFEKVEGVFERGKSRVNRAEAESVVKEIRRRYEDGALRQQSVGVVTFNISQQGLIEDLLTAEYERDAAFDTWANSGEEPLFVKNLENVQGDERDVILFSIAFGPDAEGKLSMNFGPLNREGGWKRLNVAVTRAREEMIVYSVMTPEMIDLRRTKAKGVEALRNFLEYAEKGDLYGTYTAGHCAEKQGVMESICRELAAAGFEYETSVGRSGFRVDIAVINPYNREEYLLGILLDGDSYRDGANTKDREIAQADVLKLLGWDLHRVWTMDWWDNREKEIWRILQILNEKKKENSSRSNPNPASPPVKSSVTEHSSSGDIE